MTDEQAVAPPHQPVLFHEIIASLRPGQGGRYLDGTIGAAGHAMGILQASSPDGALLGLDVDPAALKIAELALEEFSSRVTLKRASYGRMAEILGELNWPPLDAVLLDLGASSMQFDTTERGFSFSREGPLDMRFDPDGAQTAADLVNDLPEKELADIIYLYGEERRSRTVARAIVKARPLQTTTQLAAVVARALRAKRGRINPATRTFQALRIAVNNELDTLKAALPQALAALKKGGRLAVIAFHSLEDRIVKQFMRRESRDCICPPEQPICDCDHKASITLLSARPMRPQSAEVESNPRARSARLRVAEKI